MPGDTTTKGDVTGTTTTKGNTPGGKTTTTKTTKAQSKTEKKLSGNLELQIFVNGSDNNVFWEGLINDFEDANPDVKVITRIGTNVGTQLATRWMQGNPPDIANGGTGMDATAYMESGLFEDLTDFAKTATVYGSSEKIWDKIKPESVEYFNGKIYHIPNTATNYGLWYDAAYFKKNGLTVPKNYEDLMALADKCQKLGIGGVAYPGTSGAYLYWGMIMPALAAYGKDFFDQVCSAKDPSVFKSANFKAVMQRLIDLAGKNGGFMKGTVAINHTQSQMQWLNHRAALMSCGSWLESEMKTNIPLGFEMRYSTASLVTKSQKPTVVLMGGGMYIAAKGKNKENAKEFLRFMYQDKYLLGIMESYGYMTATKVDASKAKLTTTTKEMIKTVNSMNVVWKTQTMKSTFDNEFRNVNNAIVLGNIKNVDEACNRLYDVAKKNLK